MTEARKALAESEIVRRLADLPGWQLIGGRLRREFRFKDFSRAFAFMTRVALLAEKLDHHPDWSNVYNRLTIDLWTHDAAGVTDRDVEFAQAVSKLADVS
jgi:4a-hydroxytetrahydrobiopterin dehydratase